MNLLLGRSGSLGLYLLAWVPVGALLAALLALPGFLGWAEAAAVALPLTLLYAFVCLGAGYVCQAVPVGSTPLSRLAVTQLGAAALSASLWLAAGQGFMVSLARSGAFPSLADARFKVGPVLFGVGLLLFLLASALHYVLAAVEASRRAETEALRLDLLSRDAELKALRAQIHPHFLFNSLNSISALIGSDPAEARRACGLLAEFLRGSLTLGRRDRVSLSEEARMAERLLALEKIRFGARLRHEIHVESGAEDVAVPPLLLQPLVENAVKHGIANLLEGGTVVLTARRQDAELVVTIENPRDPEAASAKGAGIGLENVRRRLVASYGRGAQMTVHAEAERFRVELRLPVQEGAP